MSRVFANISDRLRARSRAASTTYSWTATKWVRKTGRRDLKRPSSRAWGILFSLIFPCSPDASSGAWMKASGSLRTFDEWWRIYLRRTTRGGLRSFATGTGLCCLLNRTATDRATTCSTDRTPTSRWGSSGPQRRRATMPQARGIRVLLPIWRTCGDVAMRRRRRSRPSRATAGDGSPRRFRSRQKAIVHTVTE